MGQKRKPFPTFSTPIPALRGVYLPGFTNWAVNVLAENDAAQTFTNLGFRRNLIKLVHALHFSLKVPTGFDYPREGMVKKLGFDKGPRR